VKKFGNILFLFIILITSIHLALVIIRIETMAKFSDKQIEEINAIISDITKELKPNHEIGARDRKILAGLLLANKIDKSPKFFPCKREYSEAIVSYFTKEKNATRNRFSMNAQSFIFLL
jgi:N-acetyl-anhydromuramyl-L-alanine amidase AmpD